MPMNLLEMRHIYKDFSGVQVLKDVNLEVREGEIHAICGENGAGKSTLMKILSGVYAPSSYQGEIEYDGKTARFASVKESEAAGLVIIHQELALIPYLSIAENVFIGTDKERRFGLINWGALNDKAEHLVRRVGLDEEVTTPVGRLGVGKQQLVEIAKALGKNAKLLILDEPTAALNDDDSEELLAIVREMRDEGVTVIIISHKLNEIRSIADRVTILRDGETIKTLDMKDPTSTTDAIISAMVGRSLTNMYPERTSELGAEILRIENWTVEHPVQQGRMMLRDVSLDVREGEVVGIAGLMGAGRTELAMSIFGQSYGHLVSGDLYLKGKKTVLKDPGDAIAKGVAYASEDRKAKGLNLIDDIRHNISRAALKKLAPHGLVNSNEELAVAEKYRDSMKIRSSSVLQQVGALSGGNQQKVVLSKWLFADPEVLILDEPTRGIDVGAKYEIYALINEMVAQGKAVIVISSEIEELLGISDRIVTVAYGHVTGEISTKDATQERLMELMTQEPQAEKATGAEGAQK